MKYDDACKYMEIRVKELQPDFMKIAQDLRAIGVSDEQIHYEMCFSLMHEGFRIRDMISGSLEYGD
jgi:hypothetical protein